MSRNKEEKIYTQEEKNKIEQMYNDNIPFVLILHEIGGSSRQLQRHLRENGFRRNTYIKWTDKMFKEVMAIAAPDIEVLGEYTTNSNTIHCRCKIDGYEWYPLAGNLLRGYKCPVCGNQIFVPGINDIWTVNPELGKMLDNPEDGYKYGVYSNIKLNMHCPNCNSKKYISPSEVMYRGFCCGYCNDGISYPEKFMRNLLNQLNIEYIPQYSPDWIKPRRYDFYISRYNIIIETNGLQHYKETFIHLSKKSLEEEKINDVEKEQIAYKNGINEVIYIDCSYSDLDYIKNSICNNINFNKYFEIDNIDWIQIEKESRKSLVFDVCNSYKFIDNPVDKSKEFIGKCIGEQYNICADTVINYLTIGSKIGLCNYTNDRLNEQVRISSSKKIYEIGEDLSIVKIWKSVKSVTDHFENFKIISRIKSKEFSKHELFGHYWFYEKDYKELMNKRSKGEI